MDNRPSFKALGLFFSFMLLVTVVTAMVALRLQAPGGAADTRPAAATGAAPAVAGAATALPTTAAKASGSAAAPAAAKAAGAPGGQCTSGATSLVQSQGQQGGIHSDLGALQIPKSGAPAP